MSARPRLRLSAGVRARCEQLAGPIEDRLIPTATRRALLDVRALGGVTIWCRSGGSHADVREERNVA
jgi:hypothetical protein